LLLRRGPYLVAAGLDESIGGEAKELRGRFINLFDSELRVLDKVTLTQGSRYFLLDLDASQSGGPRVLASACKAVAGKSAAQAPSWWVQGVADTPGVVLIDSKAAPKSVTLAGTAVNDFQYLPKEHLLWVRFPNEATPRELTASF
jgi:hypothetical protein